MFILHNINSNSSKNKKHANIEKNEWEDGRAPASLKLRSHNAVLPISMNDPLLFVTGQPSHFQVVSSTCRNFTLSLKFPHIMLIENFLHFFVGRSWQDERIAFETQMFMSHYLAALGLSPGPQLNVSCALQDKND